MRQSGGGAPTPPAAGGKRAFGGQAPDFAEIFTFFSKIRTF